MTWAEKENIGEHLHLQFVPHLISGPAQQRLSNPKVRISSHLPKLLKEIHLLPLLPKVLQAGRNFSEAKLQPYNSHQKRFKN
jgi:hypothetical protein